MHNASYMSHVNRPVTTQKHTNPQTLAVSPVPAPTDPGNDLTYRVRG